MLFASLLGDPGPATHAAAADMYKLAGTTMR
jgi:hypothetical protein